MTFASLHAARPKIAFVAGWGRPGSMMIDDEELRMVESFSEVLCFIPDHPALRILFPAFACAEVRCLTIIESCVLQALFDQSQSMSNFRFVGLETADSCNSTRAQSSEAISLHCHRTRGQTSDPSNVSLP